MNRLVGFPFVLLLTVWATILPAETGAQTPQALTSLSDVRRASTDTDATLASLVAELGRNNPALAAARRDIDMRVARIAPAGAPPDPTLSFGYMGGLARPPFFPASSTPNAFRQVGASQEIPFPGKLSLRSRIATVDADASRWTLEDTRLQLTADLKATYFAYQFATRSLAIVQRNREILDQFRQMAEARFSVGQAIQQDVLKAQLEISGLIERTTMLERQREGLRARINGLLYRQQDTSVDPDLVFTVVTLPPDVATLRAEALQRYPALKRDEQQITRSQQQLALARKEILPDFGINVAAQKMVGGMPWMYGVDVMVTVPIFWQRKQRPMVAEAVAGVDVWRRTRDNTVALAEAQVTELYVNASSAKRLMDLYSGSILPQARLTLESALASYQVGKTEFLTVLTDFVSVLAYEIGLEEQRTQYHAALAGLEPLVAAEFIK
ncbi:MAG TPA: TolC family protein [Gemmatimonadaceae bacterium]|jgi:outer membrane protein, heavy metal efflux system|nr:TolC family protein [Gemmatimonadaceae bacterium]